MASHVALTHCFFCGKPDKILLAKTYLPSGQPLHDLEPANGKVIDMEPCQECEELMKKGVILLTIDSAKSDKNWNKPPDDRHLPPERRERWMPNPHRTGGFFVLTDDAIRRLISPEEMASHIIKYRWSFIEHEAAERLGLFAHAGG